MKKPARLLTPAKNSLSKRKKVVVYDVESKKGTPGNVLDDQNQDAGFSRAFLITLFDGERSFSFRNEPSTKIYPWWKRAIMPGGVIDKLFQTLLVPEYSSKVARIYAHNGGHFDHLFLLGWLYEHADEYRFEVVLAQSRIQRLDVWRLDTPRKKLCWSFVDSISIIPLSLEEAGKTFQTAEQKDPIDLNTPEDDPIWDKYCMLDTKSLHAILVKFHRLVESLGGEVGLTAPATAINLFLRRFLKGTVERHAHFKDCKGRCEDPKCARKLFPVNKEGKTLCDGTCHGCLHAWVTDAYYGGRTELFRRYGKRLLHFDINSSYPRAMMDMVPVGKKVEIINPTWEQCRFLAKSGYCGLLECDVFIPKTCHIPPLPYRHEGKLKFPKGHLVGGTWNIRELLLCEEPEVRGTVSNIRKAVFYEGAPIFAKMVETIYKYRDKSNPYFDEGLSFIAKLILNSLYGKFGQKAQREAIMLVSPGNPDEWPTHLGGVPYNGEPHKDRLWKIPVFVDLPYMIPQIAQEITSNARIRLFRAMLAAMRAGIEVFNTDTDSLTLDGAIATGDKLGEWKHEYANALLEGDFVAPKHYRLRAHKIDCKHQGPPCMGCSLEFHLPSCKDKKKCKGCAYTVQRMKGVGGKSQTSENFDRMLGPCTCGRKAKNCICEHRQVLFTRVLQARGILSSWGSEKESFGPEEVSVRKMRRTGYDKRIEKEDGSTEAIWISKLKKELEAIVPSRPVYP